MSTATVHIGLINGAQIVRDYYQFSRLETIGPGQIETGAILSFNTLEGLADNILASGNQMHVIVNHGSPDQGLLIQFTANSPHNATGPLVGALAELVTALGQGALPPIDPRVVDAAAKMGVDPLTVIRLVTKFAQLRQQIQIVHLRGCNLGRNLALLNGYKLIFHAGLITAPNARMFYLRIRPHRPPSGASIPQLANQAPATPNTRRRMFLAGDGSAGPLLVDVHDIDGHTQVESFSMLDDPAQAPRWGALLTGRWTNVGDPSFVLPVLWDNAEATYHCPLENGYRARLSIA